MKKDIKIIGCGGIENAHDITDYLNNGATFVQLASCFYDQNTNKLNIDKINSEIKDFLQK
jgi:dihydroorotate dehydrogenase